MRGKTPYSKEYDDLYSSEKGAVEESKYVFIEGNNLTQRFQALPPSEIFTIGELGFGVGINFLTTCKEWLKHTKPDQYLDYYSFDKYLFQLKDFQEVFSSIPELGTLQRDFENFYPKNIKGLQRINLFDGRVGLNLALGEIEDTNHLIEEMKYVDAWYFDGFSPSKNIELWTENLFKKVSNTCHSKSTFSTYTSSGLVKNNLRNSNFEFKKISGFSQKRHMLKGISKSAVAERDKTELKVAVIGSGLTGSITSYMLAKRGVKVKVFEKEENICSGASAHQLLVTYPRLSAHDTAFGRFNLHSFIYATKFYDSLGTSSWKKTGVVVLNHDEESNKKQNSLLDRRSDNEIFQFLDIDQVSSITGIDISFDGLFYKDAGYVIPQDLCEELLNSRNIKIHTNTLVKQIEEKENKVELLVADGKQEFDYVCLCTGSDTNDLYELKGFGKKRGQVSLIKSEDKLSLIKMPICAKGYISPGVKGLNLIGSSYSDIDNLLVREDEHETNLKNLRVIIDHKAKVDSGKVGFRATSKDHLPIVGGKHRILLNTSHGSKASVSAPICGEIIASLITNRSLPMEKREIDSLLPDRFN